VLIAVALGIASVLAISAQQKTRQIGILKAMGLSDSRSGLVFLLEALILACSARFWASPSPTSSSGLSRSRRRRSP